MQAALLGIHVYARFATHLHTHTHTCTRVRGIRGLSMDLQILLDDYALLNSLLAIMHRIADQG